jgi:two-component system CheB/CheR fusion protein
MSNDDSDTAPCSILVVDDNHDALESLAMLLTMEGYSVCTAGGGLEALKRVEQDLPDVAVIDITMPGMDGNEVARRVRAQPWGQHIILLALTGWAPDAHGISPEEAGFDGHVMKPVDIEQLKEIMARARARARNRARIAQAGRRSDTDPGNLRGAPSSRH